MMSIAPATFIWYCRCCICWPSLFLCLYKVMCVGEREGGERARIVSDKTHVKCQGRPHTRIRTARPVPRVTSSICSLLFYRIESTYLRSKKGLHRLFQTQDKMRQHCAITRFSANHIDSASHVTSHHNLMVPKIANLCVCMTVIESLRLPDVLPELEKNGGKNESEIVFCLICLV